LRCWCAGYVVGATVGVILGSDNGDIMNDEVEADPLWAGGGCGEAVGSAGTLGGLSGISSFISISPYRKNS